MVAITVSVAVLITLTELLPEFETYSSPQFGLSAPRSKVWSRCVLPAPL